MKVLKHRSAKAAYYDTRAHCYDELNEDHSKGINALLAKILKANKASTVLDLTCGTGSQVFYLTEQGFSVVGSDISPSMLKIARKKAKAKGLKIKFLQGDCCSVRAGFFDAAITIFNAIGHLTQKDFDKTIQNINRNLRLGGLYIFDIFNLDYLKHSNNIAKLTIDWMTSQGDQATREIQFSTISDDGILASYSTYIYQDEASSPTKISKGYTNTLQVYSAGELKALLEENGFAVLKQTDIHGKKLSKSNTPRILTVAKKIA